MVLYLSARILQPQASGGIFQYYLGLLAALAKKPGLEIHTGMMPLNFREIGAQLPANVTPHHLTCLTAELWADRERELIARIRPDWVIYSYPDLLDAYEGDFPFKTAVCIPDLQHFAHPFFFPPAARAGRDKAVATAIGSADLILTLSQHVKDQIMQVYGCDESLVKIVHPAAPPHFLQGPASREAIAQERKKRRLPGRYAIFPGNFWPHKNHDMLLDALELLRKRGLSIPLVLTGSQCTAGKELSARIARGKRKRHIFAPGFVSNEELHALVSGADCLLFPSLFEGFGIPVAEGMAVDVPVACSDVCSLPEVGGDAVRYFDPENVESMAAVIREVWETRDEPLIARAREYARRFDYDHSATGLLDTLKATPKRVAPPGFQKIVVSEPVLVSIITPSYQQGQFLKQCIESVLTQDYPRIEYMVLDGGSTDESRKILESYGDRFFWSSQPDGGQTAAINTGLRRAKGTILAYLNSDDILLPGAVSRVVEEWRKRPSVDLFYGRANMIDAEGGVIREYDTREFDLGEFKGHCYICQPAAFWHRRILDHVGLLDENFHTAMDYEYWQRIAAHGGLVAKLDQALACSRDYETTKTRSQRGKVFRDIFKSQLLHWGRIHPLWWRGWLDYLKREKRGFHRHFIPSAKKTERLSSMLSGLFRKWQPARLASSGHLSKLARRIRNFRESGYYSDGWTGTAFRFPLTITQESRVHLDGICPEKKTLRIVLDTQADRMIEVEAGTQFHYEQHLKPGRYMMRIYCDPTFFPADDREIGFFIHATNLFSFREAL